MRTGSWKAQATIRYLATHVGSLLSWCASHRNWSSSHSGHSEECSSAKSAQSTLPWLEALLDLPWSGLGFGFYRDQFPKRSQYISECPQKLPSQMSWGLRNLVEARQEPQSSPSSLPSPQSSSPLQNRSLHNVHYNTYIWSMLWPWEAEIGASAFAKARRAGAPGWRREGRKLEIDVQWYKVKLENLEENSPILASGLQGIVLLVFSTPTME